jgi:hypothetical protein
LAERYTDAHQWQPAYESATSVLDAESGNAEAVALRNSAIDSWRADALNQGDWSTWLGLRAIRK